MTYMLFRVPLQLAEIARKSLRDSGIDFIMWPSAETEGKPKASDAELSEAIVNLHCDSDKKNLPDGEKIRELEEFRATHSLNGDQIETIELQIARIRNGTFKPKPTE